MKEELQKIIDLWQNCDENGSVGADSEDDYYPVINTEAIKTNLENAFPDLQFTIINDRVVVL